MPSPSFVNAGTFAFGTATSLSPGLPGSRVNGNLLVAYGKVNAGSGTITVTGAGWTEPVGGDIAQGGTRPTMLAYRYVDGTEGQPTFHIGATSGLQAWVLQYTGVIASGGAAPIADNPATNVTSTGSSVVSCPAITTTANNSLAVSLMITGGGSGSLPTPSGWTSEAINNTISSNKWSDLVIATGGTSSGSPSVTFTQSNYTAFVFEIRSETPTFQNASIAESITLADTLSGTVTFGGSGSNISESISLSDTISATGALSESIAESISLSDMYSGGAIHIVNIAESLSFADTISGIPRAHVGINETMGFTDSFNHNFYSLITIFQTECVVSHRDDGTPEQPAVKFTRTDPTSLPREIEVQYSDIDQDYAVVPQIAKQQYGRIKNGIPEPYAAATSTQKMSITSAFGIRASGALTLAYDLLYRLWTETITIEFEHPDLRLEAGDVFVLIGDFGQVIGRIAEATWTKNRTSQIKAVALAVAGPPLIADSGFPSTRGSQTTSGSPNVGIGILPPPSGAHIVGAQDQSPTNIVAVSIAAGTG
jgi:hypothetical protein